MVRIYPHIYIYIYMIVIDDIWLRTSWFSRFSPQTVKTQTITKFIPKIRIFIFFLYKNFIREMHILQRNLWFEPVTQKSFIILGSIDPLRAGLILTLDPNLVISMNVDALANNFHWFDNTLFLGNNAGVFAIIPSNVCHYWEMRKIIIINIWFPIT